MYFGQFDDLFQIYIRYGVEMGFSICKRSSRNDIRGVMKYVTITCACEGTSRPSCSNSIDVRPVSKTKYKARLTTMLGFDGNWKITSVILNHNHELSPSKSRFYQCNRFFFHHMSEGGLKWMIKLVYNWIRGLTHL